jgi:glucose-6-phosphate dehydrogenase assembly protein OpcA
MGLVADIERTLARQRARQRADAVPELRTSTMTHVVWVPTRWLPRARAVLAGLAERHPARTILLVPMEGRTDRVEADARVHDFPVGDGREVLSEVIEVRLWGRPAEHPASVVLPLLISDLPAFCRWRGEPLWGSSSFTELLGVCDRLVVDSTEWRAPAGAYGRLAEVFPRIAVSDLAYRRTLGWKVRLSELWPGVRRVRTLAVTAPKADAVLLHAWLCSRLRRDVELRWTRADAPTAVAVAVDGVPVALPVGGIPSGPDLLSAELDVLGHDPVYEAAVRRAARA